MLSDTGRRPGADRVCAGVGPHIGNRHPRGTGRDVESTVAVGDAGYSPNRPSIRLGELGALDRVDGDGGERHLSHRNVSAPR